MAITARRIVLHPSLIRKILLYGGDRTLTILLWTGVATLILGGGFSLLTLSVGIPTGLIGQYVLIKLAAADPHWFSVYFRHFQYKRFYPAR